MDWSILSTCPETLHASDLKAFKNGLKICLTVWTFDQLHSTKLLKKFWVRLDRSIDTVESVEKRQ